MFFIEKNDKPKLFQKIFNIVTIKDNVIKVPIYENMKIKNNEVLAKKTDKIIRKNSKSKKVVLSKEIINEKIYINYLNTYGIEIADGRWLYKILIPYITKYIIEKKGLEKVNISILINDLTDIDFENIKVLARQYNTINIVTNHIEKFRKLEKDLEINEGIIITITNNKKKSLLKSEIIINIDFTNELINKYNILDNAIIIDLYGKTKINRKRFNGEIIKDYEIDYKEDVKENDFSIEKYYCKDVYEAEFYKKQSYNDLIKKIKNDRVKIKQIVGIIS